MIQEFKDFINRGNVMDLAVAVVLAAAFTPIVTAVVDRVLMPLIGLIFGQPNFDTIGTFACQPLADAADPTAGIATATELCQGSIGSVLTALVSFLLVAFAVFLVVKAYNKMQKAEEEAPAGPTEVDLLTEIRDQLSSNA